VWPKGLGKLIKFSYLVRSGIHDPPASSMVPKALCCHVRSSIGINLYNVNKILLCVKTSLLGVQLLLLVRSFSVL
jgi:hypothetical protein